MPRVNDFTKCVERDVGLQARKVFTIRLESNDPGHQLVPAEHARIETDIGSYIKEDRRLEPPARVDHQLELAPFEPANGDLVADDVVEIDDELRVEIAALDRPRAHSAQVSQPETAFLQRGRKLFGEWPSMRNVKTIRWHGTHNARPRWREMIGGSSFVPQIETDVELAQLFGAHVR